MSAIGARPSTAAGQSSLPQRAARLSSPLSRTLLVLTFTTGLVDESATSGRSLFTANMTGTSCSLAPGSRAAAGSRSFAADLAGGSWQARAPAACFVAASAAPRSAHGSGAVDRGAAALARGDPRGREGPRKRGLGRCRDRVAGVRDGVATRRLAGWRCRPDNDRAHDDADRPGRDSQLFGGSGKGSGRSRRRAGDALGAVPARCC